MTIQEIHIAIDVEVDKSLLLEYPYIQPEVKDYWLNKAQTEVVDELSHPEDPREKGFENGEKRIDELRDIVITSPQITPVVEGNTFKSNLPNDYFRLVRHRCTTTNLIGNKTIEVGGIQSTLDQMNVLRVNPFWEPIFEEPLFFIQGNKIIYETSGNFTVNSTILTYLKTPRKMQLGSAYSNPTTDVECEFQSEDMQYRIINKAVSMLLENFESQRYQTNLNESNNN